MQFQERFSIFNLNALKRQNGDFAFFLDQYIMHKFIKRIHFLLNFIYRGFRCINLGFIFSTFSRWMNGLEIVCIFIEM